MRVVRGPVPLICIWVVIGWHARTFKGIIALVFAPMLGEQRRQ
jgi:hypothetical protein